MENRPFIDRKEFLKFSSLAFAGLMLPKKLLSDCENESMEDSHEKLAEFGLEAYLDVYGESFKFKEMFGLYPLVFSDICETLEGVVEGEIEDLSDERVRRLSSGWGNLEEDVVEHAKNHTSSMEISFAEGNDENQGSEQELRNMLSQASRVFPAMVLALPEKIVITNNSGYYNSSEVGLDSPDADDWWDTNIAATIFLHEATHALEISWEKIKPYLQVDKFAKYVKTYLETVYDLSYEWIADSSLILDKLEDHHWMGAWHWDISDKRTSYSDMTDLEKEWIGEFLKLQDEARLRLIFPHDMEGDEYYLDIKAHWLLFMREAGRRIIEKTDPVERAKYVKEHSSVIKKVLLGGGPFVSEGNDGFRYIVSEGLFYGVGHFLVGPPCDLNFKIAPRFPEEYSLGDLEFDSLMTMHLARMEAFANPALPPERFDFMQEKEMVDGIAYHAEGDSLKPGKVSKP